VVVIDTNKRKKKNPVFSERLRDADRKNTSLTVLEVGMYRTQTARVRYMPSDIYPRMSGTSSGCLTLLEFGFGACLIRNAG